nr:hypothetical protein [Nocardioides sp. JS614]
MDLVVHSPDELLASDAPLSAQAFLELATLEHAASERFAPSESGRRRPAFRSRRHESRRAEHQPHQARWSPTRHRGDLHRRRQMVLTVP